MDEPKFIGKARVTKQGQVTMPLEGRKDLEITPETELYWYRINESLIVVKEIVNPKDLVAQLTKKRVK